MRLSRFADIGMRSLMYVSAHGRRVSAREVAESFSISKDHVTKSLQALVGMGVLDSIPGRRGGFAMLREPSTLPLGALVRELEPSLAMAECFTPASQCPLTPACGLADALHEAQDAFFAALDRYTLADLTRVSGATLIQLSHVRA